MRPKLRWKKHNEETGLRAVVVDSSKRASDLWDGSKKYAQVTSCEYHVLSREKGWYWVAGWDSDVPYMNTCHQPVATEAEAKAQALAYVKKHLGI